MLFYVHLHKLLASLNGFRGRIIFEGCEMFSSEQPLFIPLPEDAAALNVFLHTLYGVSCDSYRPSFESIIAAVNALKIYECSLQGFLTSGSPLFRLFLSQAPLRPLEAYTIAAENRLHDLAVSISPHLLSCHLAECPDEYAERMGGVYFKRIHALQAGRMRALRDMILSPPYPHAPTRTCDFDNQRVLNRAWAMASAQLAWDARPGKYAVCTLLVCYDCYHLKGADVANIALCEDLSPSAIGNVLGSLEQQLVCPQCKDALTTRVRDIIVRWSSLDVRTSQLSSSP